jgi:hypothetical protein
MANKNIPTGNIGLGVNFIPDFYQTPANKKFLQATIDQLYQQGTITKTSGFIGRKNAKAATGADVYVNAANTIRQNYQLEPGITVNDSLGNVTFFKDYQDYINQLDVLGAITSNHARLNQQEFYSWDPHIDWDKFINFQDYYWLPYGPSVITIYGQQVGVNSTYNVELQSEGNTNQYLFTPDGLTYNPTLKLYRGQTYNFNISSLGNPFSFMTQRSLGTAYLYQDGVSANGVENGTITFTVPISAPSLIFYQSQTDINVGGAIEIFDIVDETFLDVEHDIIGKQTYTLSDGTLLSNGMKIDFGGNVVPAKYAKGSYYVEGVGTAIKLIPETLLEILSPYTSSLSVQFDSSPFASLPFDDSTGYANIKDYIVINRGSNDHNPWSRINRWFHKDVIIASANYNKDSIALDQNARANRPIIEFEAGLKLFNLGTTAIEDVDLVDTFTKDVFSSIEGSLGYNIDGIPVASGQRILFTADIDPLVKNNIYEVSFINIAGRDQIHLTEVATPSLNQVVLVLEGVENQSQLYWFDGSTWVLGQQKTTSNQAPLFDIFNNNGISLSDSSVYPGTTFTGTKIFSYEVGTGTSDSVLGFPLTYQNVANIGDIVFNFNLASDKFNYKDTENNSSTISVGIDTGFLLKNNFAGSSNFVNGWQIAVTPTVQAAVRIYEGSSQTNNFNIDIFDDISKLNDLSVKVYINGIRLDTSLWSLIDTPIYKQLVLTTSISSSDILTIRAFSSQPINSNGYYEIPLNLQNNSLNDSIGTFTLGEVADHVDSIIDNLLGGFTGQFPGDSNLRDLGNITQYGTKFVQHSGPLSLGIYHITSESNNIVKAIQTARDDYNSFKRNFIAAAGSLGIDTDPVKMVELVMYAVNGNKPSTAPYYFSDMVPYGANVTTNLTVVDYRIKTYPLTTVFTLDTLSNRAVGIYHTSNGVKNQLVYGQDYTFSTQGFVVIDNSVPLVNGDIITTIEYDSTDGSYVPATPTKLGLWPAYVPKIYVDTTLITPQKVIQGHDGSIVLAYGDYRDELLLELEKRIFNNIKVKYNPKIFDIADIIPGYYRNNSYSLQEFNQVLSPSFYSWMGLVGVDLTSQIVLSYDRSNPFTFDYSKDISPDGRSVPSFWRGVYRWMLDTDRPHLCPWEMLGLSQQPSWWTDVYGPAPYTSDNLIMWQDLASGILRQPGTAPIKLPKYVRPYLLKHIPVDESGNLVSPLACGLATGAGIQNTNNIFVFGDVSPVESAWRRSSYYPFSIIIASLLLTPANTFGVILDRSRIKRNIAGQLIYSDTGLRVRPADVKIPSIYTSSNRVQTAGLINYVVDLILNIIFSNNEDAYNSYSYNLVNLTPKLSYRVGAFTNKPQFNLLLESKTPLATGSVFIPQESYNISLNTSSPVKKLTYSGVIVTKLSTGFEIKGYSLSQPYFNYYNYLESGMTLNVGGISESFVVWTPGQSYISGQIVQYGNSYYRAIANTTAGETFNSQYFSVLTSLPLVGGVDATFRSAWDKTSVLSLPYGTQFTTVQEVVDFLLGYEQYLKDQGFQFDDFNNALSVVANFTTSAKEFMFWTTQNWSSGQEKWADWFPNQPYTYGTVVRYNGNYYSANYNIPASGVFDFDLWTALPGLSTVGSSVISLSPAANGITFTTTQSVVDDIANPFNIYEMFKVDGTPLLPTQLDSYREGNTVTYSPRGNDGIYCASFYLVQNEHVVIIENTDIFNDIIYNPASGYRRERLKLSGYVTDGWYGGLDIPGFVYDGAKVQSWQPWQDYNMADIIAYQGNYYSANKFTAGTATFISSDWTRLKSQPSAQLLPNWTNAATQFVDFYSLNVDNFNVDQQRFAQHLIGYQKRQYLNNIIQDPVSEFKFYQGMIREKGTQNVLNHLFGVLSEDKLESLTFYEEWALRTGRYGSSNAFEDIEIILDQSKFTNNPQGFLLGNSIDRSVSNFVIQQTPNDIYVKPLGYNSNPFPANTNYQPLLRSAGYVDPADVTISIGQLSDITKQDITVVGDGAYIWTAFEGSSWNVYRFSDLRIHASSVSYSNEVLTITALNTVPLVAGQYVGLAEVSLLQGFYQITSVNLNSFTINTKITNFPPTFTQASQLVIYALIQRRLTGSNSIDNLDSLPVVRLKAGEIIWTDDNGDGIWSTWKYKPAFTSTTVANITPVNNLQFGSVIAMNKLGTFLALSSGSTGTVITYDKTGVTVPWTQRSSISVPFISKPNALYPSQNIQASQIATVLSFSNDGSWLVTGSPTVSRVATTYQGPYSSANTYLSGNIVSYNNNYFKALTNNITGVSPSLTSLVWQVVPYIAVNQLSGVNSSIVGQGVISLYKKDLDNNYALIDTITSPIPSTGENFGSSIVFGNNVMYIGAPGYNNGVGRVYQLNYKTITLATTQYNPVGSTAINSGVTTSRILSVSAGSFVIGTTYTITSLGNTDFTAIGSTANTVGVTFIATNTGTGTGTATTVVSDSLVGSGQNILVVNSTSGIRAGMTVVGAGYTSGQQVDYVLTKFILAQYGSIVNSQYNISQVVNGMPVSGTGILPDTIVINQGSEIVLINGLQTTLNYLIIGSTQDMSTSITQLTINGDVNLTFGVATAGQLNNQLAPVASLNTLYLDSPVDKNSVPGGTLNFVINTWVYNGHIDPSSNLSNSLGFGQGMKLSSDGNTLLISSKGAVSIYRNVITSIGTPQILRGFDLNFGYGMAVSDYSDYIAISDDTQGTLVRPQQGAVGVYALDSPSGQYKFLQYLVSPNPETDALFGNKIDFMNDYQTLVVYSENGSTLLTTTFDNNTTTFDINSTDFATIDNNSGRVDIFDLYNTKWIFSETLTTSNKQGEGYGTGFAVGSNQIAVSAPSALDSGLESGKVYAYTKLNNTFAWTISSQETEIPDISKIRKVFLYNKKLGTLVDYIDVVDPLQGKIPGPAQEEIKYQTFYDPATYSYSDGTVTVNVAPSTATEGFWSDQPVGRLWWNLTTAKFINNYFVDPLYRNNAWNTLAVGASIDIYEWVSYNQLPSAWDNVADTPAGLSLGISGKSLYGNSAYSVTTSYDSISKVFTKTYYFWVKNKKIIPDIDGRNMSASDVAKLISNPRGQDYTCIALTGTNSFSIINGKQHLNGTDIVLAIEYWTIDKTDQNIHSEWKLISDDPSVDLPNTIEQKWFDSLCGIDQKGRAVPDPTLPVKLRYGIENRPRQSMFVNRIEALKEFIERVNIVLSTYQVTNSRNISALETYDPQPTEISGLWDISYDTEVELQYANVGSFIAPILTPIIVNGRITGINIINSGKGYAVAPYIEIVGSGQGAVIRSIIDALGQITGATVISSGEGYNNGTLCTVRSYSALIKSDSSSYGAWSIYSFENSTNTWSRTLTQSYDVRNYWTYKDWYATGYSQFDGPDFKINTFADLFSVNETLSALKDGGVGILVRVINGNNGQWVLLNKYSTSDSIDWTQSYEVVGIENGTIQFKSSLYEFAGTNVGYDANIFDGGDFDVQASAELRIILNTIKNNILIDDLKQNYLDLFFTSVRYAHAEQPFIDWIFKTSFVRATHTVGKLGQPVNYPIDNLSNFQDYVAEVKPYRTKVREYISNYTGLDTDQSAITDFDLQPTYRNMSFEIVDAISNNNIQSTSNLLEGYPWKFWYDNVGFKITEIIITNQGSGYLVAPQVIIDVPTGPNAVPVTATAFISNGKVNRVILNTTDTLGSAGAGFLVAPTITFNGGLGSGGTAATAVAIIGDGVVRSNRTALKFDRVNYGYYISTLSHTDTFTGSVNRVQFALKWAPDLTIGKTSVTVNGTLVLRELYSLSVVKSTSAGYTQYTGNITFTTAPATGSTIVVNYHKDVSILNATDRIQYFYNPTSGQYGKDLSQLMTGTDYGGVTVSGLDFNVSGGWNDAPYLTDSWDNRDPNFNDYSVQVSANTHVFTLPYTPATGTNINVYYVKQKTFTFTSDGSTDAYSFDQNLQSPTVTVTTTALTVGVSTNYVALNSAGFTVKVGSTLGIVPGMVIYGQGFLNRQKVLRIANSSTIILDAIPDNLSYLRFYNTLGSSGTTMVVSSTSKIIPGMLITATNLVNGTAVPAYFLSGQTVIKVVSSTVLIISAPPDVVPPNGQAITLSSVVSNGSTLTFSNIAGGNILTVNSVAGLKVGAVVTNTLVTAGSFTVGVSYTINSIGTTDFTLIGALANIPGETFVATGVGSGTGKAATASAFSYDTTIQSIDTTNNTVTLSQVMLLNTVPSTQITFTETLVELKDVVIVPGNITLSNVYTSGSLINITGTYNPIRLDDPNYGTVNQTNASAIIKTPVIGQTLTTTSVGGGGARLTVSFSATDDGGSASTTSYSAILDGEIIDQSVGNSIEIPASFAVGTGDRFILRENTSDGSIPTPNSDYDTRIDGGNLAYTTATGLAADDIIIDGDGLVTANNSPAPEEVVPGQVVDTLAVKVYDQPRVGSASIKVVNYTTDGTTTIYKIGQMPNSSRAVIVKLGSNILTYNTDYSVNYTQTPTISLINAPSSNQLITIYSIGFSGYNVLDIDYFIGDGSTVDFVTRATWNDSVTSLVYVNGVATSVVLFKTDSSYEINGSIGIQFDTPPPAGALINYILVAGSQQTFAVTTTQSIAPVIGISTYTLAYPIGNNLPYESNMIVRVGQTILSAPNNSYFTIGSNRLNYTLDPAKATPLSVPVNNIMVYAGGILLNPSADYTVDPTGITVKINRSIYSKYAGTQLIVSIVTNNAYSYNPANGQITFATVPSGTVEVIGSYVQNVLDIERTTISYNSSYNITPSSPNFYSYKNITGGIINLDRSVLDGSYVWVIKNSTLLTNSVDYVLNSDLKSITLQKTLTTSDTITLITFGSNILEKSSIAYMQFKDMLNRVSYKRLNINKQTQLAQTLRWNDTSIVVVNASTLDAPNPAQNKPGVIEIRGERIEYFTINGNTLGQLRRGTLGTGVTKVNPSGTYVQGIGPSETIPYIDNIQTTNITSLGTNSITLPYIVTSSDQIEIFVGGENDLVRLKKAPYKIFSIDKAPYSPAGDVSYPADFTVNGTNTITLTNAPAFGTRITVVKTTGTPWDGKNPGGNLNVLQDSSAIATFIKAQPGTWYNGYIQISSNTDPTFDESNVTIDNSNITFDEG